MGLIIWDIEEEKEKNRKSAEKILKNFPNVKGLKEVLDDVQSLMDSNIYEKVYEASNLEEEIGDFSPPSIEYLLNHYRQDRYSSKVLKNPSLNLFTDNIIFSHYLATTGTIGFVNYVYKKRKLSLNDLDKQHAVLERLMSLLDDFDKPQNFQPPTEEFYEKLKNIGWDKKGKKLHKKMYDILYHLNDVRFGGSGTFSNGENFTLTFLAACNAVNQNRDNISPEDVVMAYKTFSKLINTDITKLV
ncbi:MAG: hypothetical protein QMD61_00175 [Methanobacterium sp.]|nr:hypothetical protein [Methanobacterium sp.]